MSAINYLFNLNNPSTSVTFASIPDYFKAYIEHD